MDNGLGHMSSMNMLKSATAFETMSIFALDFMSYKTAIK